MRLDMSGDRDTIRLKTVLAALKLAVRLIKEGKA